MPVARARQARSIQEGPQPASSACAIVDRCSDALCARAPGPCMLSRALRGAARLRTAPLTPQRGGDSSSAARAPPRAARRARARMCATMQVRAASSMHRAAAHPLPSDGTARRPCAGAHGSRRRGRARGPARLGAGRAFACALLAAQPSLSLARARPLGACCRRMVPNDQLQRLGCASPIRASLTEAADNDAPFVVCVGGVATCRRGRRLARRRRLSRR